LAFPEYGKQDTVTIAVVEGLLGFNDLGFDIFHGSNRHQDPRDFVKHR
jgi:hypothetical protein